MGAAAPSGASLRFAGSRPPPGGLRPGPRGTWPHPGRLGLASCAPNPLWCLGRWPACSAVLFAPLPVLPRWGPSPRARPVGRAAPAPPSGPRSGGSPPSLRSPGPGLPCRPPAPPLGPLCAGAPSPAPRALAGPAAPVSASLRCGLPVRFALAPSRPPPLGFAWPLGGPSAVPLRGFGPGRSPRGPRGGLWPPCSRGGPRGLGAARARLRALAAPVGWVSGCRGGLPPALPCPLLRAAAWPFGPSAFPGSACRAAWACRALNSFADQRTVGCAQARPVTFSPNPFPVSPPRWGRGKPGAR